MKGSDILIIGGLAVGAYFLYKFFFSGSSDYYNGGGGGGSTQLAPQPTIIPTPQPNSNLPKNYAPTTPVLISPKVYATNQVSPGVILPSKNAPIVQQTTSIITKGSRTQIGQPAYSGRTIPYIMPQTGTYAQQTQAQRIDTILNPSLLKANIGMTVRPMTTKDYPIGTPQHPGTTPTLPKGVLMPFIR